MPRQIRRKWRPPLAMVLGGTLSAVLCFPLIGIVSVRYLWPIIGYREAVLVAGSGVVLATGLLGWSLWRILFRPMQALRNRAQQIRRGEEEGLEPLAHYGTADMRDLGHSFMEMGRVLTSREAVLRGYADHVTHELKSPLTVLRGATELLATPGLGEDEKLRLVGRIESSGARMQALLEAQRAFARAQEPGLGGSYRVSEAINAVRAEVPSLTILLEQDRIIPVNEEALKLTLGHLFSNAVAHGATEVTVWANEASLTVRDNGRGISDGNASRIFEPYFTTRRDSGGTGMGLPIVQRILDANGANIRLLSGVDGAAFEVTF